MNRDYNRGKRAVLMARVSSDEQAKGYSLDVQTEAIEGYCLRNGIEIVYTIREDHSAKSFERPEFNRFLFWLKGNRNQVDLLLFTSWDRFSRNAMDAYRMIERLGRHGVEAQAIEQPIDFSVPENKMMLAMYLVMPEVDNDRRSIKIRGGIRAALKAGRWCRAAPYGYRNTRDENNRPSIVPSDRADVIRWAFEQVAKGQPQSEVRAEVNRKGIPVQRSRFSEMLRNPMYMGMIEIPAQDNEPYMLIKGQHEALVSEEVFSQVQQVLTGNFPRKRLPASRSNELLPLRGILKCTGCGGKLTGSRSRSRNGTQHAYYHCNHCRNERYRAEMANATVTEIMNSLTLDSDAEIILEQLFIKLLYGNSDQRKRNQRELKEEIQGQNTRIQTLQDNLADGVIGGDDYREMRTRYISLRDEATRKLSELSSNVSEKKELLEKAVGILNSLGDMFENGNVETRSKLLGSIFPEMIEFDGEKCRTTSINEALLLCLSIDAGFSQNKNRTLPEKLVVSGLVVPAGVEPATHGFSVRCSTN
jgi:site-specific DNA recombinase